MKNNLTVDPAQAKRFLVLLDESTDQFTFQTLDDNKDRKDKKLTRVFNGTFDQWAPELARLNALGAGVFVTVNQTDLNGRKTANMMRPRCVWIEDDNGGAPNPSGLEPQIIIQSSEPHKQHRYFLIEGATADTWPEWDRVQERLVLEHFSDPNAKDRSRVLRLPGFWHQKDPANPRLVRIVHESGARPYTWEKITRHIPPMEARETQPPSEPGDGRKLPELRSALATIDPDCGYKDWLDIGMAIHHETDGGSDGFELWDEWSRGDLSAEHKGDKYPAQNPAGMFYKWNSFTGSGITGKTIFKMAYTAGWSGWKRDDRAAAFCGTDGETVAPPRKKSHWKTVCDEYVARMNKTHASVLLSGKHRVMRENHNGIEFISRRELELVNSSKYLQIDVNEYGKPVYVNPIKFWAEHPDARTYTHGVIFLPGRDAPENCFNTWTGFSVQAKENPLLLILIHKHLFEVICDSKPELYIYLLKWIAFGIQYPDQPAGSAVVLRGKKGSGKGTVGHFLRRLWGKHSFHIHNAKHLIGNFNAHLADVCFLFADEAFFSGDRQHEGVLKSLITEPVTTIERKSVDAIQQPNYLKIFMSTNSEYAVPATADERRFCVFDVVETYIGNRTYFNALNTACTNPDVQAAFLYEMQTLDLTGFHTGNIPESVGLRAQRYHSMDSVQKWLVDFLTTDKIWSEEISSSNLYATYISWCDQSKTGEYRRVTQTQFGTYLGKVFQRVRKDGGYSWYYFGNLKNAISRFEKYEKISLEEITLTTITNPPSL